MMKSRGCGVETQATGRELKSSLSKQMPIDVKYIFWYSAVYGMEE